MREQKAVVMLVHECEDDPCAFEIVRRKSWRAVQVAADDDGEAGHAALAVLVLAESGKHFHRPDLERALISLVDFAGDIARDLGFAGVELRP